VAREYPERPVVGVGAVVWRGDRVLLIRRGTPPRLGQWSLPGGAQQLGETLVEAVVREVREETALALTDLRFLTTVDLIEREPGGRVRYHYTLVDFTAEAAPGEAAAGDDAAAVAWFGLAELDGLGLWSETLRIIGEAAAARRRLGGSVASAIGEDPGEIA
jgi:ADP-ribose pyrophosphatase YjhB (NUDIX family)